MRIETKFKKTEICLIPEDWGIKKVDEIQFDKKVT